MEAPFRIRFPFESPTDTLTPFSHVNENRYITALEAQTKFPRRLRIIQDIQNNIGSREVLESLDINGTNMTENQSTKAFLTKTTPHPYHVIYDYEVLPIYTEVTTRVTRSILNLSTGEIIGQDVIVGIRIEKTFRIFESRTS